MKKKYLIIFALLLMIPFTALAATGDEVATLTATSSGSTVNYEGTTEGEVHAVMCKLYDETGEEIDMLSSSVDNATFEGSFTDVEEGTYEVSCARYEGGEVKTAEVTVGTTTNEETNSATEETTTGKTSSSPQTGDRVIIYAVILVLGIVGLISSVKIYKKN